MLDMAANYINTLKQNRKINVKQREWLFDILAQRAELGSIIEALPTLIKRNKERGKKGIAKAKLLERIFTVSKGGVSISESIKDFIPEDEYYLIASAEESGKISEGLEKASHRIEQKIKHKKAITGVLSVIGYRFALIVGLILFLGKSLFPSMEKLAPVEEWHEFPQFVYGVSQTVPVWGAIGAILILVIGISIYLSLNHLPNSKYRSFLMNYVQPWSIHRELMAMTVIEAFDAMVGSRSEKQALEILKKTSRSPWLKNCLHLMIERIGRGVSNPLLDNPLIPEEQNDVLASLGSTGDKSAFYKKSVIRLNLKIDEKMELLKKRIELTGTIALYVAMGSLVISYILVSASNLHGG